MRILMSAVVSLVLLSADVAIAQHQAPAGASVAGEALQLHLQLFANPRTYRTLDGRSLIVGVFRAGDAPAELRALEPQTGRLIALTSVALDRLSSEGESFTLINHGQGLVWRHGDSVVAEAAFDAEVRHSDVSFANGSTILTGRLTTAGADRRPAVVMVHGSGFADRNFFYYGLLANYLVDQGFAVLTSDKRCSGGECPNPADLHSIPVLASDVAAAVRFLQGRPEIDASHVGAFGLSQGGWLGPLAAAQADIAYLALFSAPPVDTWTQEMNEAESDLTAAGFSVAQRQEARNALRLMFESVAAGEVSPAFAQVMRGAHEQPWAQTIELNDSPEMLRTLRDQHYDPAPALRNLRRPTFLAFGGADLITPYQQYAPIWSEYARNARASEHQEIRVFSGAGHGLTQQGPEGQRFAPGVLESLATWLRSQAGLAHQNAARTRGVEQWRLVTDISRYSGAYRTEGGIVTLSPLGNGAVRLEDIEDGRDIAFLYPSPRSPREMIALSPGQSLADATMSVALLENGRIALTEPGRRRVGRLVEHREEEAEFMSAGLRQHAIVVSPTDGGRHPAILFIAGSGPSSRLSFLPWAYLFAEHGYVAMSIDKRGYGGSEGDPDRAVLADNTADIVAAIDHLATRADVDARRIGLLGTSRGGWIAAMAARARPLDFIIVSSGGPVSIREQERYRRLENVVAGGYQADRETAARVLDTYFDYLASSGSAHAEEVSANFAAHHNAPWYSLLLLSEEDPTIGEWPSGRLVFADDLRLDARGEFNAVNAPILFVLGDGDPLVPAQRVADIAREMAGPRDWQVRIFEGADHGLMLGEGAARRRAPGYFEAMFEWLDARRHRD